MPDILDISSGTSLSCAIFFVWFLVVSILAHRIVGLTVIASIYLLAISSLDRRLFKCTEVCELLAGP